MRMMLMCSSHVNLTVGGCLFHVLCALHHLPAVCRALSLSTCCRHRQAAPQMLEPAEGETGPHLKQAVPTLCQCLGAAWVAATVFLQGSIMCPQQVLQQAVCTWSSA
jgi:hypothetical protein